MKKGWIVRLQTPTGDHSRYARVVRVWSAGGKFISVELTFNGAMPEKHPVVLTSTLRQTGTYTSSLTGEYITRKVNDV